MKVSPIVLTKSNISASLQNNVGVALALLAVAIVGVAGVRWARVLGSQPEAIAKTSDTRAWALLGRALQANSQVPFSAHVDTVVFVGARGLQSEAQMVSAPDHLSITYLSGPIKGHKSGFSDQLFWRQNAAGQLIPYAEVATRSDQIAQRRFELMRANYEAHLRGPDEIAGRPVEVIEVRPARPIRGLKGPARRIFIDDATGLTLRTETFNSRLQPVSHSTFSKVDLQPGANVADFRPKTEVTSAANQSFWEGEELGDNARAVEQQTGLAPPQSDALPAGWKRDGFGVHRCGADGKELRIAAFTRYTDGLNVLTLFAVKDPTRTSALDGFSSTSPSYRCSFGPATLVSRPDGAGTLLAIGDLPPQILSRVLNKARFEEVAFAIPTPAPTLVSPVQMPGR